MRLPKPILLAYALNLDCSLHFLKKRTFIRTQKHLQAGSLSSLGLTELQAILIILFLFLLFFVRLLRTEAELEALWANSKRSSDWSVHVRPVGKLLGHVLTRHGQTMFSAIFGMMRGGWTQFLGSWSLLQEG